MHHPRLYQTSPPYERFTPFVHLTNGAASARPVPGTVFGWRVEVDAASDSRSAVLPDSLISRESAVDLRLRWPSVPAVLWAHASTPAVARLAMQATTFHVCGVVFDGEPLEEALRSMLACPSDLSHAVTSWLESQRVRLSCRAVALIHQIITAAPLHSDLCSLLRAAREPEAAARQYFRARGIPSPSEWLQLAHALQAALRIQERPEAGLMSTAAALGYSDAASLSRQLTRVFGARPTEIRRTLGWMWLMERWTCAAIKRYPRFGPNG